ncbi:hypothetical protein [Aggregatibacter actinomycetemcomitans]|uniref:hypothetical protein n=1 Tax=Aggregatibacter actinomycetemcomitans TaxID=714 RepID=UPI001F39FA00|nr:hypothetical protein [Aggregatibacter actinomycetemcomitans]
MLKQHHTIAQVSKMMSVSTSALQRRGEQYLRAIKYYIKQIGRYFEIHCSTLLCWKKAKANWNVSGIQAEITRLQVMRVLCAMLLNLAVLAKMYF